MAEFQQLTSRLVVLPLDDIDTDQIIPARYLKVTDRAGLGQALFADWRYDADGAAKAEFPLNHPSAEGRQALIAGRNFGCGSSREHAPWALTGFGLRAVIALSFADIFRNNALKNGLLPVALDAESHARLLELLEADPAATVSIDLASQTVTFPDGTQASFPMEAFAKSCLLRGVDELGYILTFEPQITAYESRNS